MKSILITVCLSNDNVSPLEKHETPPNSLHIGYHETLRLLGKDWKNGPLLNFLKSFYNTNPKDFSIIHVRDWHDLDDPSQKDELEKYGPHCLKDSEGAKFIWEDHDILIESKNKPYIINSKKIATASEEEFIHALNQAIGKKTKDQIKIGIIGVLTNIKVAQMAIALQGFFDIRNIGICSALTASNNIRKHFQGLDDLSNIYGIKIFNSVSEFSSWLKIKSENKIKINKFNMPEIKYDKKLWLNQNKINIISSLFPECKEIELISLGGGFSSSELFLVNSIEKQGFVQVPTILKMDKREIVGKERIGFEKIQYLLGSHVPRIINYIESGKIAGIRYSFAMMNKRDQPKTFRDFYTDLDFSKKGNVKKLDRFLDILFEEILEPMYSNCFFDQKQLWVHNTFKPEYNKFIIANIEKILDFKPEGKKIKIKGIGSFYNPILFYNKENINKKLNESVSYVRQSLSHGDLNTRNIILDDKLNIWLIDFFHTDYDNHIIQDIVKLENDLKFIHTPIKNKSELKQLIQFEKSLMSLEHLSDKIPPLKNEFNNPNLKKLHFTIKKLRKFAYKISKDKNIRHYRIPQLRYAGHNLSFEESTKLQKTFALISTSMLCDYFNY